MAHDMSVLCGYCGYHAELRTGKEVYPHMPELADGNYWVCSPCDARVGCHKSNKRHGMSGKEPLGVLANGALRKARSEAHKQFDRLWKTGRMSRTAAYKFLSQRLALHPDDCHIALFDIEQCIQAADISRSVMEHIE